MLVELYIWTVVAVARWEKPMDWRPIGEYHSVALCEKAINKLGIEQNRARCVIKKEK